MILNKLSGILEVPAHTQLRFGIKAWMFKAHEVFLLLYVGLWTFFDVSEIYFFVCVFRKIWLFW